MLFPFFWAPRKVIAAQSYGEFLMEKHDISSSAVPVLAEDAQLASVMALRNGRKEDESPTRSGVFGAGGLVLLLEMIFLDSRFCFCVVLLCCVVCLFVCFYPLKILV